MEPEEKLDELVEVEEDEEEEHSEGIKPPGMLTRFNAYLHNRRRVKTLREYNDKKLASLVSIVTCNAIPSTAKTLYNLEKEGKTVSYEEAVRIFYNSLIHNLSPESKKKYGPEEPDYTADSFRYVTRKQLEKDIIPKLERILDYALRTTAERVRINKGFGYELPHDKQLPIVRRDMYGLIVSALMNYSEDIKTLRITDHSMYDYLGAFLKEGKRITVLPRTGNHLGFERENGSEIRTRYAQDLNKEKSLLRVFYERYDDAIRRTKKMALFTTLGTAAAISTDAYLVYKKIIPPIPPKIMDYLIGTQGLSFPADYTYLGILGTLGVAFMGIMGAYSFSFITALDEVRYQSRNRRLNKLNVNKEKE